MQWQSLPAASSRLKADADILCNAEPGQVYPPHLTTLKHVPWLVRALMAYDTTPIR